jgi:hypothetical protein
MRRALHHRSGETRLLEDMGQFVREEALAACRARLKLTRGEEDPAAYRGGAGAKPPGEIAGRLVGMDADAAQIVTEARLEECASSRVECFSG